MVNGINKNKLMNLKRKELVDLICNKVNERDKFSRGTTQRNALDEDIKSLLKIAFVNFVLKNEKERVEVAKRIIGNGIEW